MAQILKYIADSFGIIYNYMHRQLRWTTVYRNQRMHRTKHHDKL